MENNSVKRLFIALNLSQEIKNSLNNLLNELRNPAGGVKWCGSKNLHLTLNFLGNQDKDGEQAIIAVMKNLAGKFGQIKFGFGDIDGFPNFKNSRVIFINCRQLNGDTVFKLQSQLAEKLNELGFEIDHRLWRAHLTLGRVKAGVKINLPANLAIPKAEFVIKTFELMESKLAANTAEYIKVESFKL
ncbi:MAG: RNA 2',3'-cyclic phosphodiesterase [Candidatus Falkowbacteria bacterium]